MSTSPTSARVLVVDDDATFRTILSGELSRRGYVVSAAGTGQAALARAAEGDVDIVLLDLRLPDADGIDVLKQLREKDVAAAVIILTGHGTIDTAIRAVRLGAHDYLEKPCPIDAVDVSIRKAHEHVMLVERQRILEDGFSLPDFRTEFVGVSPALEKVRQTIERIAPTDSAILILGETGVGKDMVAKLTHARSARRASPFVVVDCAALHAELLQSELFGHEKGAFTGAARQKHGLFEVAHGGTLFLDEVGDTNLEIQAKLLRVLETGRFRRLGGTKEIAVDVRIISATNRDLKGAIERGHFRGDLFFRLSTLTIEIPPLRERREDVAALVEYFLARFGHKFSRMRTVSSAAMEHLLRYRWPGNVRELLHVLEQVVVLSDRESIEPSDLPPALRSAGSGPGSDAAGALTLEEVNRRHVLAVVEMVGKNRAQAARLLGVSERNLYRLLKKYEARSSTTTVPDLSPDKP